MGILIWNKQTNRCDKQIHITNKMIDKIKCKHKIPIHLSRIIIIFRKTGKYKKNLSNSNSSKDTDTEYKNFKWNLTNIGSFKTRD